MIKSKHKCSLTTIEEECYREDPIVFTGLCYPMTLQATTIIMIIFLLELLYLSLDTFHLLPQFGRLPLPVMYIYFLGISLDFIISCISLRYLFRFDAPVKTMKFFACCWINVRTIVVLWDVFVTIYYLFLTHTEIKYRIISLVSIYLDLIYRYFFFNSPKSLYVLFLGFYLHVAVERLRRRSTQSNSTTEERGSSNPHLRGGINSGPNDNYYINLRDCDYCSSSDGGKGGKGGSCGSGGKEKRKGRRRDRPGVRGDIGWGVEGRAGVGVLEFDWGEGVEVISALKQDVKGEEDGNMINARKLKDKTLFGKF